MAKNPEPLQFELPLSEVGCKSLRAGGLDTAMIAEAWCLTGDRWTAGRTQKHPRQEGQV